MLEFRQVPGENEKAKEIRDENDSRMALEPERGALTEPDEQDFDQYRAGRSHNSRMKQRVAPAKEIQRREEGRWYEPWQNCDE
jgi:hypothetical protein